MCSQTKPHGASVQTRLLKKECSDRKEGETARDGIDSIALEGQGEKTIYFNKDMSIDLGAEKE